KSSRALKPKTSGAAPGGKGRPSTLAHTHTRTHTHAHTHTHAYLGHVSRPEVDDLAKFFGMKHRLDSLLMTVSHRHTCKHTHTDTHTCVYVQTREHTRRSVL